MPTQGAAFDGGEVAAASSSQTAPIVQIAESVAAVYRKSSQEVGATLPLLQGFVSAALAPLRSHLRTGDQEDVDTVITNVTKLNGRILELAQDVRTHSKHHAKALLLGEHSADAPVDNDNPSNGQTDTKKFLEKGQSLLKDLPKSQVIQNVVGTTQKVWDTRGQRLLDCAFELVVVTVRSIRSLEESGLSLCCFMLSTVTNTPDCRELPL